MAASAVVGDITEDIELFGKQNFVGSLLSLFVGLITFLYNQDGGQETSFQFGGFLAFKNVSLSERWVLSQGLLFLGIPLG